MALATLRSLVHLDGTEKVELILSDNASSDGLHGHVMAFSENELPQLKIFRQESNLGFAGNLRFLANQSTSRWIWFIGVGETITPGAVEALLAMLEEHQPDHLLLNTVERDVSDSTGFMFAGGRAWFHEAISLNIFSRSSVVSTEFISGQQSDNWWPHLKIFLNCFETGGVSGGLVSGMGVVSIAANYSGWWYHKPTFMDIYLEKLELIRIGLLQAKGNAHPASVFLEFEMSRLTGIQFGLMIAENRKQGLRPFSIKMFSRARALGIRPLPLLFGVSVSLAPVMLLRMASRFREAVLY